MRSSFESDLRDDAVAPFTNGYDGVLESFSTALVFPERLSATIRLRVARADGRSMDWYTVTIQFERVDQLIIDGDCFEGGGFVLYNGARVLRGVDGALIVDLDPGVAWLTPSHVRRDSNFLLVGRGSVVVTPFVVAR